MAAALDVCRRAPKGSNVLFMVPDTGERYLSTPLFEDISADMDGEEMSISESTPGFRFGGSPSPAPKPAAPKAPSPVVEPTPEATAFVDQVVADRSQPVVLFALEWCEFCWSVRKLFKALGVPYRSIDLDSVEFQRDDFGGKVRAALSARIKATTIPQIFLGGQHFGGCTDLFDAFREGRVQARLGELGIAITGDASMDPRTLLPKWQHPRTA
jgi:cysteine synthase A